MSINSIYEVPQALQDHILDERGLRHGDNTARRSALETLRGQWSNLVDTMTYGQMNDLIGIRRTGNGRLDVTYNTDHNYRDGVLLAVPYRFITPALVEKFLAEYIDWLEVEFDLAPAGQISAVHMKPVADTSNLRKRAFAEVVSQALVNLRGVVSTASSTNSNNPRLVIEGASVSLPSSTENGLMVYQTYWLLLVAKEVRDNLMDLMRAALRGQNSSAVEAKVIKRDTGASFKEFADGHRRAMLARNIGQPSIENLPMPTRGAQTPRTWGIEVEAAGARGVPNPGPGTGWVRKGDGSLSSAYDRGERHPGNCPEHDHSTFRGRCEWLDSTRPEDGELRDTAEFVSPILSTAHSAELETLLDQLSREPQNDTAGVHVHVDVSDLTPRNIGALVFAYQMIEPVIEEYYRRETRNYCRVRTADSVLATVRSSKDPKAVKHYKEQSEKPGSEIINYGDRYVSVNLQALEAHGTVEFRSMGPVYNYEHLIKWALFVREMVAIAKLNLPPKVWTSVKTWKDLEKIILRYGTETAGYLADKVDAALSAEEAPAAVTA